MCFMFSSIPILISEEYSTLFAYDTIVIMQEGVVDSLELVTPATLWIGFVLVFGVFALISAILLYHWHKYTFEKRIAKKAMTLYFSVSGVFLLLLIVSLLSLTL